MAKKEARATATVETLKPYLDRALNDKEFRDDLKEALSAAKKLYGPLVKDAKDDGAAKSASRLATDEKVQENLRKALEEFGKAAGTLKGKKKKSHKGRHAMLLAGLIAGALYNPWSGSQTREWLMDKVAGDDDLQPLEEFDFSAESAAGAFTAAENGTADVAAEAAEELTDASDA